MSTLHQQIDFVKLWRDTAAKKQDNDEDAATVVETFDAIIYSLERLRAIDEKPKEVSEPLIQMSMYQACPICEGHGTIRAPHMQILPCPTCKGERIIPMHIVKTE